MEKRKNNWTAVELHQTKEKRFKATVSWWKTVIHSYSERPSEWQWTAVAERASAWASIAHWAYRFSLKWPTDPLCVELVQSDERLECKSLQSFESD